MTSTHSTSATAVFTIVAKNYLPYARVLMRSLAEMHPGWSRFVLLADRLDGYFDPAAEPFEVIEAETLPIPDFPRFSFRYTILELNTAVKPWFFRHLFEAGFDRVVYLDPDIRVYHPLTEVDEALGSGALAVLVPHLTGRLLDTARPTEHEILQSGAYNLGFCAIARHAATTDLLDFWCEKSLRDFVVDLPRGLFTDQRWMDLVPGMFPDVTILRHPGYDVAYWNLPHRRIEMTDGAYSVNGAPLVFFHFSGVQPDNPRVFSKHQDRFTPATAGLAASLVREYDQAVVAEGYPTCAMWPYAYAALHDGSPIPDVVRKLYRTTPEVAAWAGEDPFARPASAWNESIDTQSPPITRVMLALYHARADLRLTWPDVMGRDRAAFARWFAESSEVEGTVPACYVAPLRQPSPDPTPQKDLPRPTAPAAVALSHRLLVPGALRKAYVALREGRLPMSPRRWHQLYRLHIAEHVRDTLNSTAPPLPALPWPEPDATTASGGQRDDAPRAAERALPSVTLVGYLTDGTGVSAGASACAAALDEVDIGIELVDARPLVHVRGAHDVNILHVNADQVAHVAGLLGRDFFRERYTIGVWNWELEDFPDQFMDAFPWISEIWASSHFIQRAVAAKSPVPVVHMPYAITVSPSEGLTRRDFGLPDGGRFLFLMMYDVLSIQERKNPLGAIEAFRRAFPRSADVGLVIRVNHAASRPEDVALVRRAVADMEGVTIVDKPLSRADAQALLSTCDALVSLHRSEGFGLNIAEAMLLGKPVVVTGWSGNMDFTTPQNACLVDYDLVPLSRDYGPYRAGSRWAEPDLSHAARWMQQLVADDAFRRRLASRAQTHIANEFSPAVAGQRYLRRLSLIRRA